MMKRLTYFIWVLILPLTMIGCGGSSGGGGDDGALTLSSPVNGSVVEDGIVMYTIPVTAGNTYAISLQVNSGDADLTICNSADCPNTLVGIIDFSDLNDLATEEIIYTATYTGTLYIFVDGWLASSYSIRVDLNVAPETDGVNLSLSTPVSGSVVQGGIVMYSIPVTAGNTYAISLQVNTGDADLFICNSADCLNAGIGLIDFSGKDGLVDEEIIYTATYTGALYIFVDGYLASSYSIRVDQTTTPGTTTPIDGGSLSLSTSVSGSVAENQVAQYTLAVTNGASYAINLQTVSGDADLIVCQLSDCSGGFFDASFNSDLIDENITVTATYTGTLYIFVEGYLASSYILTAN